MGKQKPRISPARFGAPGAKHGVRRGSSGQTEPTNAQEIIEGLTEGYGADVVLECSGANASVNQCLQVVKKLGRYTQVGLFGVPVQIDLDEIVKKQLRVQGSMCHTWETWRRTLSLMAQNVIDLNPLITGKLPLDRWEEGFDKVINKEGAKILLLPGA